MVNLMVLMVSSREKRLVAHEDWHNRCDTLARQGLVASPKYLLGESLYLPSDPPAQKARGVADRESRLDPVPSLLLWPYFPLGNVAFDPPFCVHSVRERMIRSASASAIMNTDPLSPSGTRA
jgi:hypothetical protein